MSDRKPTVLIPHVHSFNNIYKPKIPVNPPVMLLTLKEYNSTDSLHQCKLFGMFILIVICARAQSISQHVDTKQLNVPT